MTRAILTLMTLAAALPLWSCQPAEETHLQIVLYSHRDAVAKLDQSNLLRADGPANEIEMILVNLEGVPEAEQMETVSLAEQRASFTNLPYDTPFRLLARGLYTDASGASSLQFYGASAIFEVKEGEDQTVAFQVGRANCVALNQGSSYISDATLNEDTHEARVGATATRLSNGRVVLIGGGQVNELGDLVGVYNSIEIFEPDSSRFSKASATLLQGRAFHTATLLPNDEILLVGGASGVLGGGMMQLMSSASLVRFDAQGAAIVEPLVAPQPLGAEFARYHHQAVRLGDGSALIMGGFGSDGAPLTTTLRYFPANRQFLPQRPLQEARARFAAEAYGMGNAVLAGGLGVGDAVLNSIEVFAINPSQSCPDGVPAAPENGCFIRLPSAALPVGRWGLTSTLIDDGNQVLFIGGHTDAAGEGGYRKVEIFNGQFSSLQADSGELPAPQGRGQATLLKEGDVLVSGGMLGGNLYNVAVRLQTDARDPATGLTTHLATYMLTSDCSLSEPRAMHNATLLQHGVVLLTGGLTGPASRFSASRRVEMYFPSPIELGRFYAP
ncbi:hypothetical protein KKB55_13495 [Myxococcota bacterium]|nr:hypothetical protein [Myxococcota bacterium]MBU1898757.1 hypothetical protein [Myxococcota bacterium]